MYLILELVFILILRANYFCQKYPNERGGNKERNYQLKMKLNIIDISALTATIRTILADHFSFQDVEDRILKVGHFNEVSFR